MSRYALIIGNDKFLDQSWGKLTAPSEDVRAMTQTLRDPAIGAFEVRPVTNRTSSEIRDIISDFVRGKRSKDLVLVYFSGHGALVGENDLILAVKDTRKDNLMGRGLEASFILKCLNECLSKSKLLILDCCFSGSIAPGLVKGEAKPITPATFGTSGQGQAILTASNRTQWASEAASIIDSPLSLFTHYLLEGLRTGAAARQGQEEIDLDDWFDYASEEITVRTAGEQRPNKFTFHQEGTIVIAKNPCPGPKGLLAPTAAVRIGLDQQRLAEQEMERQRRRKVSEDQARDALRYGNVYYESRKYKEAVAEYARAAALDPENADAFLARGRAYMDWGRYEPAAADFTRYIELSPDSHVAYHNRAMAYSSLRKYELSVADYTRAIELQPGSPSTFNGRALAYAGLQKYDQAIADYSRAIQANAKFSLAYFNRGLLHLKLEKPGNAVPDLSRALELGLPAAQQYQAKQQLEAIRNRMAQAEAGAGQQPVQERSWWDKGLKLFAELVMGVVFWFFSLFMVIRVAGHPIPATEADWPALYVALPWYDDFLGWGFLVALILSVLVGQSVDETTWRYIFWITTAISFIGFFILIR